MSNSRIYVQKLKISRIKNCSNICTIIVILFLCVQPYFKVCRESVFTLWPLKHFSDLLTTQTHTIRSGALRFPTLISPLLNYNYKNIQAVYGFVSFCLICLMQPFKQSSTRSLNLRWHEWFNILNGFRNTQTPEFQSGIQMKRTSRNILTIWIPDTK